MEVQLNAEQADQLQRMAAQRGRGVEELASEAVDRYLAEEAHFRAAVEAGRDAAARGDFAPSADVWASVERELRA